MTQAQKDTKNRIDVMNEMSEIRNELEREKRATLRTLRDVALIYAERLTHAVEVARNDYALDDELITMSSAIANVSESLRAVQEKTTDLLIRDAATKKLLRRFETAL